ncbi:MAG: TetR/AcrR family transcriptional regulator [Deltaproteobacteria bacterium]|nr:TetR/AcrR family transcriptional regulator [Deltaproteobacteria bacterium]
MRGTKDQREAIITAAAEIFSRFGLEKTTMEDIARSARKSKSALYYYFKSKEEVFAEVIRKEIAGLKHAIREAVEREDDPYYRFRTFVRTRLDYLNKKADQYTTVKDEYLKHYAFINSLTEEYSNWEVSTLKGIVEYGRDRGLFEVTDTAAVSEALFFALKGLEYPWAINYSREEIARHVEVLIDLLLRGISRR